MRLKHSNVCGFHMQFHVESGFPGLLLWTLWGFT